MVSRLALRRLVYATKILRSLLVLAMPLSALWLWQSREPETTESTLPQAPPLPTQANPRPTLDWYAPLWQRDLQQKPHLPTSPTPQETPKPSGPVPVLVATFVDARGRFAHFQDPGGRLHFKTVADWLDRFEIVAIEPGRVQLREGSRELWLDVPVSGSK